MFSVFSTIVTFFLEILLPFYFFVCCMLQMGTNVGAVQPLRSNNTVFFPRDINSNLFGVIFHAPYSETVTFYM